MDAVATGAWVRFEADARLGEPLMVTLLETPTFLELELAQRAHLENSMRRIPGGRSRRAPFVSRSVCLELKEDDVLVVPLRESLAKKELREWIAAVVRKSPLEALCGLCFVLQCDSKHDPRIWEETHWTEVIDRFSEIALPTRLVVWTGDNARLDSFRLVEALSSLLREMDSLNELRRLGDRVDVLEEHFTEIFSKLRG